LSWSISFDFIKSHFALRNAPGKYWSNIVPVHTSTTIDSKMLELLVCPLTKGILTFDREHNELISKSAKLAYPVRDGIPILLPSEARAI
jgi:uncharacterized protein